MSTERASNMFNINLLVEEVVDNLTFKYKYQQFYASDPNVCGAVPKILIWD